MALAVLEDHDMGDCEKTEGYLCEECRIWYMERADEYASNKDDLGWEGEYQ